MRHDIERQEHMQKHEKTAYHKSDHGVIAGLKRKKTLFYAEAALTESYEKVKDKNKILHDPNNSDPEYDDEALYEDANTDNVT